MFDIFKNIYKKTHRSVVFYRQSYYHFYYLSRALRERGWDAIVVNLEPKDGANKNYYHGEDMNLYDPSPSIMNKKINDFYSIALKRFKLMHFAGDGYLSFFMDKRLQSHRDITHWKKQGNKVAYTISGCNSGTTPQSVANWSISNNGLNVCDRCIWQNNSDVCSNKKSVDWGKKIHQYCDLICSETLPALDYMSNCPKIFREPLTTTLDPEIWSSPLEIPLEYQIRKDPDEILIYHAVGNYESRNSNEKNIKGTFYVIKAIEKLQSEGFKVKLMFFTNIPNIKIRYYQAQADIIVDQLNIGRYGATAREGMMLGKPVICYINNYELTESDKLISLQECPLVSATEITIYDELKKLVMNKELRASISKKSRDYALKWHSSSSNAERYEEVYDRLFKEV